MSGSDRWELWGRKEGWLYVASNTFAQPLEFASFGEKFSCDTNTCEHGRQSLSRIELGSSEKNQWRRVSKISTNTSVSLIWSLAQSGSRPFEEAALLVDSMRPWCCLSKPPHPPKTLREKQLRGRWPRRLQLRSSSCSIECSTTSTRPPLGELLQFTTSGAGWLGEAKGPFRRSHEAKAVGL